MAESFMMVLDSAAIVLTLDDNNKAFKLMKKGPTFTPVDVKMEPGDETTHGAAFVDVSATV